MGKSEIIYSNDTLYISLMGSFSSSRIQRLKKKMYSIIDQYGVNHIVINKENITKINSDVFYEMLDDYDNKYGGSLIVEE